MINGVSVVDLGFGAVTVQCMWWWADARSDKFAVTCDGMRTERNDFNQPQHFDCGAPVWDTGRRQCVGPMECFLA